jgi:hypothetical protein
MSKPETLVLFAYNEQFQKHAKSNLEYFLGHALTDDPHIHFIIIDSSDTITVQIPTDLPNLQYLKINNNSLQNNGKAWNSWYIALTQFNQLSVLLDKYQYFIFLKDTVKGPLTNNINSKDWCKYITNKLDNDCKMTGLEYIILPNSYEASWVRQGYTIDLDLSNKYNIHVITPLWATDKIGLQLVLPYFTHKYKKKEFIINQIFIKNNYNVKPLTMRFNNLDLRTKITTQLADELYNIQVVKESNMIFEWTKKRKDFII